jgi:outer membrane protein OmpA-like peptidoglycan-associated protein
VLAKSFPLARSVHFGSNSAKVNASDAAYLRSVRAKLAGAKVITCVGHADNRGSAKAALALGRRRAKAACAILAKGRKVIVHTASTGEKAPTGRNNTSAGRARNRRVDVTVHN